MYIIATVCVCPCYTRHTPVCIPFDFWFVWRSTKKRHQQHTTANNDQQPWHGKLMIWNRSRECGSRASSACAALCVWVCVAAVLAETKRWRSLRLNISNRTTKKQTNQIIFKQFKWNIHSFIHWLRACARSFFRLFCFGHNSCHGSSFFDRRSPSIESPFQYNEPNNNMRQTNKQTKKSLKFLKCAKKIKMRERKSSEEKKAFFIKFYHENICNCGATLKFIYGHDMCWVHCVCVRKYFSQEITHRAPVKHTEKYRKKS